MKINLHNYEAYLLDHSEGNLSLQDERELALFLEEYPHVKEELLSFESLTLVPPAASFQNKSSLKKAVYTDEKIISYIENLLSPGERKELETEAEKDALLQKQISLYKNSVLVAEVIPYPVKEKLKKRPLVIAWQSPYVYFRAAAALLLLAGLFFIISKVVPGKQTTGYAAANKIQLKPSNRIIEAKENQSFASSISKEKNILPLKTATPIKQQDESSARSNEPATNEIIPPFEKPVVKNEAVNHPETDSSLKDLTVNPIVSGNIPVKVSESLKEESYFNVSADDDEEDKPVLSASAKKPKKGLFKILSGAAEGAEKLGIKGVGVKEDKNAETIHLGGISFSESY